MVVFHRVINTHNVKMVQQLSPLKLSPHLHSSIPAQCRSETRSPTLDLIIDLYDLGTQHMMRVHVQ